MADWFPNRAAAVLWGGPEVPDPLTPAWAAQEFADPLSGYFVLVDGQDRPVAVAGLREIRPERRLHLMRVGVAPALRGRGVGKRLVAHAVARGRRTPWVRLITLKVSAGNVAALRLYARAGFVADTARYDPDSMADGLMRLMLKLD